MIQILALWRVFAALAIVAGLFASGFGLAWRMQHASCEAAKVKPLEQAIEHHAVAAAAAQVVEHKTAVSVAKTAAIFNGIQLGVLHHAQKYPLAGDCRLDADGLRLWRAANADLEPDRAGSGDAAVSSAGAATLGPDAGSAGRPRGDGAGLPPVPRASPGPDPLDQGH